MSREMVAKAKRLAYGFHNDQIIEDVVRGVGNSFTVQTVAYLYKAISEEKVTSEIIRRDFPEEIANAVEVLACGGSETYAEYIWKIGKNKLATKVKKAELRKSMGPQSREKAAEKNDHATMLKYNRTYKMLSGKAFITSVNPYGLKAFLKSNGWSEAEEANDRIVLDNKTGIYVRIPLDLESPYYDFEMKRAVKVVCHVMDIPYETVISEVI